MQQVRSALRWLSSAISSVPQLAFKRWTEQRYWEVAAIYEDRHEVAVVGAGGRLMRKSIPFKRTKVLPAAQEASAGCWCADHKPVLIIH